MRASEGLSILGKRYAASAAPAKNLPYCLRVVPSTAPLAVSFRIEENAGRTFVVPAPLPPAAPSDQWTERGKEGVLTLRWSHHALEEAAYGFTFWYIEQLGARAFASHAPKEWSGMSFDEMGVNAAKSSLYAALMRFKRGSREEQRAIALYNSYGFGYAIGMNFRTQKGARAMLFFEDLVEIKAKGFSIVIGENGSPKEKRIIRGYRLPPICNL